MGYVLFTTIILGLVNFCFSTCIDCLVTQMTDFNDILISDYQMWSRKAPRQDVCYHLCYLDEKCASFQYNSVSGYCRGHASSFKPDAASEGSTETGNKLYLTCRGDYHFGAACDTRSDCHTVLNDCMNGTCLCRKGLLDSNTWTCEGYLGCFEDRSVRLLPYRLAKPSLLTNEWCVQHCLGYGYKLAGTEVGGQCYCGNIIRSGYQQLDETRCGWACKGDPNIMCGGPWAMSVYTTGL